MSLTKTISISVEVYDLLEKAKLPNEDLNDTILRLIAKRERIEFLKKQKQILDDDEFQSIDQT